MKNFTFSLIIILNLFCAAVQAATRPSFVNNEYIIETVDNLRWLAEQTNAGNDFRGVNFRIQSWWLGAYNENWTPIGTEEHPFRGNFDGNGHTFAGLTIDSKLPYVGLFGYVEGGVIKNICIKDYRIITTHSKGYAGVLAGYSDAVIINCVSIGGDEWWSYLSAPYCAGGLVGKADHAVYNSQARNLHKIEKAQYTGGVVGEANALVTDCFSNMKKLNGHNKGHMVAVAQRNAILHENYRNSEWTASEDDADSKDGARLDASQFTRRLNENRNKYYAYQPLSEWTDNGLNVNSQGSESTTSPFSGKGIGTEIDPFRIENAQQLCELANVVERQLAGYTTAYYKVTAEIDLEGIDWKPIGKNASAPFKGNFDGNFKEISNLDMNTAAYFGGLFGYLDGASVKNTALNNVDVVGVKDVGHNVTYIAGLAGYAKNSNVVGNMVYGTIVVNRNGGNNEKDMARIIGMFDNNSVIKGNYATGELIGNDQGHDNRDGETITEFDNSKTVITAGNKCYLLKGDFPSLTVAAENVVVFCRNNIIDGKLTMRGTTIQRGTITTGSLEFTETTDINPSGINNQGEIIMKRQPMVWTEVSGTGWETICLPFDANVYADGQLIEPITKSSKGAYWLREFVEPDMNDNNGYVYFASYESPVTNCAIQTNTPYILAYPGERYGVNSLKRKEITYRGYGAIRFDSRPKLTHDNSGFVFEGHFQTTEQESCYKLNQDGSGFELHNTTTVDPFSAVLRLKNNAVPTASALRIATGNSQTTDLTDGFEADKDVRIYAANGTIFIASETSRTVQIYNAATGMVVAEVYVNGNTETVENLPRGIYIAKGEKLVIN